MKTKKYNRIMVMNMRCCLKASKDRGKIHE